jgi:putative DNA primase/helicase
MELLSGSGESLRAELLSMGVQIDPISQKLLGQYLQSMTPKRHVRCALHVGWCDLAFVLPDKVIGPSKDEIIFQSGDRHHEEYTTGGTEAGWCDEIAALAIENPMLIVAISLSFSGPLLGKCFMEGGGIHFVGDSSTGKTTLIEAACSVWGGSNFRRSWRTTANGLEGAAMMFNDGLLALDEISECNPHEVGSIIYALGNGRGKQRASKTGSARGVSRWKCSVLSSGERSIDTTMLEAGNKIKAGQTVRLLNIPVKRHYGAWDNLHTHATGAAFSDAIKQASAKHHGHVGRAFLEKLTHDQRDFSAYLEQLKALPELVSPTSDGQGKRVASRLALIAMAGELATEYGLTKWPKGEAIKSVAECLRIWCALNGTDNNERRQILDQLADYIDKNCDSRFSGIIKNADGGYSYCDGDHVRVSQRAGYSLFDGSDSSATRLYLLNPAGMREALSGFDFNKALDVLEEAGVFPLGRDSKGSRSRSFRIKGTSARYYQVDPNKLRHQE